MTAEEFGLWIEFMDTEPIGPSALLPVLAEILCALANGPLQPPAGRKAFRPSDFLDSTRWRPAKPAAEASPVDQFAALLKPG